MAQTPRPPDVEAQRAAMKKLGFLVGEWSGEASVLRGPDQFVELVQTESTQFKLDGLVLVIEGVGRTKADGKLALQALALISFDDETGTYKMRAFNDGRWLETRSNWRTVGTRYLGGLRSASFAVFSGFRQPELSQLRSIWKGYRLSTQDLGRRRCGLGIFHHWVDFTFQ